jgi:SAM-dependent methyltransferase
LVGFLQLHRAQESLASVAGGLTRKASVAWRGERPAVRTHERAETKTPVETFWGANTVKPLSLWTARSSRKQLEWRFEQYPLFREFSGLWGEHDGEVVLDYGCGPGNDVVGLALYTGAAKIIGIDVSEQALALAADRVALHKIEPRRVELIHSTEADPTIPLEDCSVDFVQSQGVLHHVTDPDPVLRELHRVLRPGGHGCVMVYNRDSVWFNLYVAYQQVIELGAFPGMSLEKAFARTTDGPDCPVARCYRGDEFVARCEAAGFEAEYLGGYLSKLELETLRRVRDRAIADPRLGDEQRAFASAVSFDPNGYPMHHGKHAGIGGSYRLRRAG